MACEIPTSVLDRLLEQTEMDLDSTFTLARSVELAEAHSQAYKAHSSGSAYFPPTATAAAVSVDTNMHDTSTTAAIKLSNRGKCFWCGDVSRHGKAACPAKCGKLGHWKKVCKSPLRHTSTFAPTSASTSVYTFNSGSYYYTT